MVIAISHHKKAIDEPVIESTLSIYNYVGRYEEFGVTGDALIILPEADGSCNIDIGMYRLGDFSGWGELDGNAFTFKATNGVTSIHGQITLNSTADYATVEITYSSF